MCLREKWPCSQRGTTGRWKLGEAELTVEEAELAIFLLKSPYVVRSRTEQFEIVIKRLLILSLCKETKGRNILRGTQAQLLYTYSGVCYSLPCRGIVVIIYLGRLSNDRI